MSEINVQQIAIEALHPNGWNPNRMTKEEFAELVAEVRHLGRIAKPIIARQNASGFEIVDGEHNWRAAKDVGLAAVPCELITADNFEAMRQTYKRNQHGKHDPVLEGRFFKRMLEDRGLSQRALAKEIEVSEGTIRNALQYAQAAEVRNDYAFNKLSVKQVRFYNLLPRTIANLWLDKGASVKDLLGKDDPEGKLAIQQIEYNESHDEPRVGFWDLERLEKLGLVEFVRDQNWRDGSFKNLIRIMNGWDRLETYKWHLGGLTREMIRPYTRHFFQGAFPVRDDSVSGHGYFMTQALAFVIDASTQPPSFRMTADEFAGAIKQARSAEEFLQLLQAIILEKGLTVPDYKERSQVGERLKAAEIQRFAPEYIKTSEWPLGAKYALWKYKVWEHDRFQPSDEELEEFKRTMSLGVNPPYRDKQGEYIDDWIKRKIRELSAAAEQQKIWNGCSEQALAQRIAERLPLYDKEKNRREILELRQKLAALKKTELMVLDEWTAGVEDDVKSTEMLRTLAAALSA